MQPRGTRNLCPGRGPGRPMPAGAPPAERAPWMPTLPTSGVPSNGAGIHVGTELRACLTVPVEPQSEMILPLQREPYPR